MKEIDFLPDWYKQQRNQQISFRTKYVILGGMFFVVMTLNLTSTFTAFRIKSLIAKTQPQVQAAQEISLQYADMNKKMEQINKKKQLIDQLDPKINIPNLLAEISYLTDEKIVLEEIEVTAEEFEDSSAKLIKKKVAAVRTAANNQNESPEELYPQVKFKIMISGIAAGSSDVARLVCKLEDSDYFCNVVLTGSKPKNLKISGAPGENPQVNEFQVRCYLANYETNDTVKLETMPSIVNGRIR